MTVALEKAPYLALVDDDAHSVRLLTRTLAAQGAPRLEWLGNAEDGLRRLTERLSPPVTTRPALLIVDLRAKSTATRDFTAAVADVACKASIPIVAMASTADPAERQALIAAGAAAVVRREAEREAYRREVANIVSFWARSQRLDAVGM
ncbi:hypothetical protein [Devosia nitrariae]|nr:hypothetical protein [Devosia nitrariae]